MPQSYTVTEVRKWVLKDFSAITRKCSRTEKLKKGEYRVAMRTTLPFIGPLRPGEMREQLDFHFMKQNPKTGIWYDKPGHTAVRCLGKINPSKKKSWSPIYNSKTLYIAVKKKFTK